MHLTRRNGVYYFRKKIPIDLVAMYGRREIVYSLRTKERSEATRLALKAAVRLEDEFCVKRGVPTGQDDAAPSRPPQRASAPSATLECLIPIWRRENNPTDKTADAVTRVVAEAGNPEIQKINRATVAAMRDAWLEKGNTAATVTKKVGFIRLLLSVARNRGLIESNHAEGMALPADVRAVELRKPYSPEQVQAVMNATERMRESQPAMYWLPRLARWTGARLNELHQLRKGDVQERNGVPGLMITDEGEHGSGIDMRLKNRGSRRWVPLAEPVLGFAKWAEAQADCPLFPAKPNKFGIVSDAFSKRYGRFLRDVLKITDKRVTFHSWRHGFADMCRAAGVPREVRMALMGHSESGVSGTYGAGEGMPPKRLIEAMGMLVQLRALPCPATHAFIEGEGG